MGKYNKEFLIREIASRANFTIGDTKIIFNTFEDVVKEMIKDGDELDIVGLFSISVGEIQEHEGVNAYKSRIQKTTVRQFIPTSKRINIKPSRALYSY